MASTSFSTLMNTTAGMAFLEKRVEDPKRIVVFGRSMGGAVAARLAAAREPGGLILEAAFTSLEDMAKVLYPFFPSFLFRRLKGRFDTRGELRAVGAPTLVVHGTGDEIVPVRMGETLFREASNPSGWLPVEGAGHNDVFWVGGEGYFSSLGAFIRKATGGELRR